MRFRADASGFAFRCSLTETTIHSFVQRNGQPIRRSDTAFWREVRNPARITDRLQAKLDFWKIKPPSAADFEDQWFPGQPDSPLPSGNLPGDHRSPIDTSSAFPLASYKAILYGMDFLNAECDKWYGTNRPATRVSQRITERLRAAPHKLPAHDVWLKRMVGMADYPTTRQNLK